MAVEQEGLGCTPPLKLPEPPGDQDYWDVSEPGSPLAL